MNDQNNEDLLALYYQSRSERPSELLDQRIRKAAQARAKRNQRHWIWGLSKVAVFVLTISVVLRLWIDQPSIDDLGEIPEPSEMLFSEALPKKEESVIRSSGMRERSAVAADSMTGLAQAPEAAQNHKSIEQSAPVIDSFADPKPETFTADLADEAMPTAPKMAREATIAAISIPELPFSQQALEALDTNLTVELDQTGISTVYFAGKRILSVAQSDTGITFKAWQGSEALGVQVDWMMTSGGLGNCTRQDVYQRCNISDRVSGYFRNQSLDHIEWFQPR